jgi:hypothetical protein
MGGTLARRLGLATTLAAISCVIPIPATPEADGGTGPSDPFLFSSSPATPGPIQIFLSAPVTNMRFTFKDANIEPTIYVRVFRDYTQERPEGPIEEFEVANSNVTPTETLDDFRDVKKWCADAPTSQQVIFEAIIADRPFHPDETLSPRFQRVSEGGRWSRAAWTGICIP